jgi:hypothetical protein
VGVMLAFLFELKEKEGMGDRAMISASKSI